MINKKLEALYKQNWESLSSKLFEINKNEDNKLTASHPLLIKVNEEKYQNSDIKIMIVGQETNGWYDDFTGDMNISLNGYESFFNSNYCYSYGGQFWNGVKKFKTKIEEKYPNKNVYILWNNICKIGNSQENTNRAAQYIQNVENKEFNIIKDELEILNPDIVIFFTGHSYDNIRELKLGKVDYESINDFKESQLVKIKDSKIKNMFRTYHPGYLYRGKGRIDHYFNSIIENIDI